MRIVIDAGLLPVLFPDLQGVEAEEITKHLAAYYSRKGWPAEVSVQEGQVIVDVQTRYQDDYEGRYEAATGLAQRGQYAEAKLAFQKLIDERPTESDLYRMYGQVLFEEGAGEEAVDYLVDALRWDPQNVYALVLMGNVQLRVYGDVGAARRYYDEAIALDPDNYLTLNNLGGAMMEAGRPQEAQRYLELALEANDEYPNTHFGLGLIRAQQGDYLSAFEHAVAAVRLAQDRDPVMGAARDLAQKAGLRYAQENKAEDLFAPFLKEVEEKVGKPVKVQTATDLATAAKVEVAETHGRDFHLVRYKPGVQTVAHLVAHEIAHLELIAEARAAGQNKLFTTKENLRQRFLDDHRRDLRRLTKRGLPEASAEQFIESLFPGLNSQAYNAPVDLFIERRLYHRFPDLRPVQYLSLTGMLSEYAKAATSREIRQMTPRRVFEANVIYNLTHALQLRDLYGVDLVPSFQADRRLMREAERLYDEYLEVKGDLRPGEEYEFVQDWAEDLGIDAYFELVDEEASREVAERGSAAPEDVVEQVQRDPMNLQDPQREERTEEHPNALSMRDDPTGSMAVTMYLVDAIQLFEGEDRKFVEGVAFEVAMLGNYGLDPSDPERKYSLKTIPGKKFSALHLLALMYAGFKILEPDLDTELDFSDEYKQAKMLAGKSEN